MSADAPDGQLQVTHLAEPLERWSDEELDSPNMLFNHESSLLAFHRRVRAGLPPVWLEAHPLSARGLKYDQRQLHKTGIELDILDSASADFPAE